jgi:hypothetical protein
METLIVVESACDASSQIPVLIETYRGRSPTGLSALPSAQPFEISLALREMGGWQAYRVRFDPAVVAWIASVIDWGMAA